jgi:hypothetical protein
MTGRTVQVSLGCLCFEITTRIPDFNFRKAMTTTTTITSTLTSSVASDNPQAASIVTIAASVGGAVVVLLFVLCLVVVRIRRRRNQRVGNQTTDTELSNVTTKTSDELSLAFSNGAFIMLLFLSP